MPGLISIDNINTDFKIIHTYVYSVVLYTEFICLRIGTRMSVLLYEVRVRIRSKMLIICDDTQ